MVGLPKMELKTGTECLYRDNEKPPRTVTVHSFEARARPITNEEVIFFSTMLNYSPY
jgi:formylglycine-generating enzyme required for sulfatase activity